MAKIKHTYDQVKSEFESRGYELLSKEYRGLNYKLDYICKKHRDKGIMQIDFRHFHERRQGCKSCAKEKINTKRVPDSEIIQLCDKHNFEFIKSSAENQQTMVYYICNNHREKGIQKINVSSLKRKKKIGCNYCLSIVKKTHNQFLKELYDVNPNIEILSEYINADSFITCKCLICGHIWESTPNRLLSAKSGCRICGYKKLKDIKTKSDKDFLQELHYKHPHIIVVGKYISAKTKILFRCSKCSEMFYMTPDSILHSKYGCPKCAQYSITKSQTKTHEQFVLELKKINPNLEPIEQYKTDHEKIKVKCKVHNFVWMVSPNKILHKNTGCPKCAVYKNEKKICDILDTLNIKYELQKRFKDCKDKQSLPFDIYLYEYNILIEYDGEHHYIPIKRTANMTDEQALNNLKIVQYHDEIKNKYCKNNDIPLIRIPYWEMNNMEYFLLKKLNQLGIYKKIA